MLINMDSVTPRWVDEETGEVAFEAEGGAGGYGVIDEIAGRVLAVRRGDIPQRAELAAVPRYTI